MSANGQSQGSRSQPGASCLVQAVTNVMLAEPLLEAVKIHRASQAVSLATLGQPNRAALEEALKAQIRAVQESSGQDRCALLDGAVDCHGCRVPGLPERSASFVVTHEADATTVARVTCPTAPKFWRWSKFALPKIVPREITLPEDGDHEHEWQEQLLAAVLCGALGIVGALVPVAPWKQVAYSAAFIAGAWFVVHEVWERLQHRTLDVHFLMLAVAVGSVSIGAWGEGVTLLFLFSLSDALEHYAMGRTHREIQSLFKTAPKTAVIVDAQGQEQIVEVESLATGLTLRVKPGEQFPVDAEILRGQTACDESNLTGEATPAEKKVGDPVLGGTLNLWGAVDVLVLRPATQSALQQIIQLIREAQNLKAPSQRFTDRFGTRYTYGILGLSAVMFLVWWLGYGAAPFLSTTESKSAFYRAMTLLVVASPCALVLSIPSAILAAIAWSAKRGILFRGGAAVEKLAEVQVVALDKTGTLTTGDLQVASVESFPPGKEREVAQLAYSLERLSNHPLARAIARYGKQKAIAPLDVNQFESVTGLGLKARRDGHEVLLGQRAWLAAGPHATDIASVPATTPGYSEVWVAADGLLGRILLRDDIRPQAREVMDQLRALGLRSVVLTGDRKESAVILKSELHLDDVRAELRPEDKVEAIRGFIAAGKKVAMVGDGVNDAPSLAAAHVGVAMGARGSAAALEQAEVILMHDRLENFLIAFRQSQRARAIIKQNLVISLGTVVVLVTCALFGKIPLTLGVLGHEGSTVIVVLNSLRLLFANDRTPASKS